MTLIYVLACSIGVVAGLRAMTAPAAVSWAVAGTAHLSGTFLAFMGYRWTPWILTALALGELINDKLPKTPSRKVPVAFGARIVSGALAGAVIAMAAGNWIIGAVCGAVGAVVGTLGGAAFRAKLAAAFGKDPPAALIEDAIAVGAALLIIMAIR